MACKRWGISTTTVTVGTTTRVHTVSIATTPGTTTTATTRTRRTVSLINLCVEQTIRRRIRAASNKRGAFGGELVPHFFELIERAPRGLELLLRCRRFGPDLFLQLKHQRQVRAD